MKDNTGRRITKELEQFPYYTNVYMCTLLDGNMDMIRLMKEVPKTLESLKVMLMITWMYDSANDVIFCLEF